MADSDPFGDARLRYHVVGSNEPESDRPIAEDSKEARGRSARATQATWLRRTAFGYACVFYLSLLGISAYLFSNYGAIATGACDRPLPSAVLWSTIFCTAMYQAFFALLVVVFYDILNSTDHDFRSLQSLSQFFDMSKPATKLLTIACVLCLLGVFVSDVIGLKMLYGVGLTCDDAVQTNAGINLWVSMIMVVCICVALLHHVCTSR